MNNSQMSWDLSRHVKVCQQRLRRGSTDALEARATSSAGNSRRKTALFAVAAR